MLRFLPGPSAADVDTLVAEAVETHTPGIELGYAERTSSFVTAANGLITALSVTVVGQGRPADIEFYCAQVTHTVNGAYVQGVLIHGAGTQIQGHGEIISNTTLGRPIHVKTRMTLTDGVSYTFSVNTTMANAGTATWLGSATRPMWLAATSR